jgi:hypothetical protein
MCQVVAKLYAMTLTTDKKSAEALHENIPMRMFYIPKASDFDSTNLVYSI